MNTSIRQLLEAYYIVAKTRDKKTIRRNNLRVPLIGNPANGFILEMLSTTIPASSFSLVSRLVSSNTLIDLLDFVNAFQYPTAIPLAISRSHPLSKRVGFQYNCYSVHKITIK